MIINEHKMSLLKNTHISLIEVDKYRVRYFPLDLTQPDALWAALLKFRAMLVFFNVSIKQIMKKFKSWPKY